MKTYQTPKELVERSGCSFGVRIHRHRRFVGWQAKRTHRGASTRFYFTLRNGRSDGDPVGVQL